MKSEQDILYRIFANLAISQRSICECPEFPRRERKVVANKVIAWFDKIFTEVALIIILAVVGALVYGMSV